MSGRCVACDGLVTSYTIGPDGKENNLCNVCLDVVDESLHDLGLNPINFKKYKVGDDDWDI